MLLSRFGLSVSGFPLTLTERVSIKDTPLLGTETMAGNDSPDVFRYEISVDGTNITEYYEYETELSCDDVSQSWLADVEDRWGTSVMNEFSGDVQVTELWQTTQKESSEVIPLPPVTESSEE